MAHSSSSNSGCSGLVYMLVGIFTAIIGYKVVHASIFWSLVDWVLWPFVWLKWIICEQVNVSMIKDAFSAFLN